MTTGGRSPNAAAHAPANSGRPQLGEQRVLGVALAAAERQWRIAGLPVSSASARLRRRFASWSGIGEKTPVVVEPGLADRDHPRVRGHEPRSTPSSRRRPSRRRGDARRRPRRATEARPRARARARTTRRSSRGRGSARRPAARAAPRTWSTSASKRSALRWQWLSTRRTMISRTSIRRPRSRGAGRAAPPRRRGRLRSRGRPSAARRGAAGPPLPSAPYGYAYPSCARTRGAVAGMNGAAASAMSRHASSRSPSTLRSRAAAASSPVLGGLRERPRLLGVDELVRVRRRTPTARRAHRGGGSPRGAARSRARASPHQRCRAATRRRRAERAAHRRGSGWSSRPCGSRGCRSRWRGRRCSAGRSGPTTPRRPGRTGTSRSDDVAGAVGPERGDEVVRDRGSCRGSCSSARPGTSSQPWTQTVARRLEPGAPQHRRPEDRVEPGDVLADDVQVGRPPPLERRRVVGEAGAGDVVDQRVVPDVDLAGLRVPRAVLALRRLAVLGDRERDAPAARRPLAADREVLEAAADEARASRCAGSRAGRTRDARRSGARAAPGRPTGGRTSSARSATGAGRRGGSGRSSRGPSPGRRSRCGTPRSGSTSPRTCRGRCRRWRTPGGPSPGPPGRGRDRSSG